MEKNKRGCITFLLEWVLASLVIGVIFNSINKTGRSMSGVVISSALIGLVIAFIIFAFRMVIVSSKIQKSRKKQKAQDKQEGISRYDSIIHVGGLNAPENCKASATLSPNAVTVSCGGNEFVLDVPRIKNVEFQFDVDEKQYLKSSFAKGVVGAAAFGVAGAVIGSAPKTKTKREVKCYAIISYESAQGEYKTFLLKDGFPNTEVCAKLVDALRPKINQQVNRVTL